MDEEFVTDGLRSDRYLKAAKLVEDFESEVTEAIDQVCQEIIDDHSDFFNKDVTRDDKVFRTGGSKTLATLRVEFGMRFENELGDTPKLNIAMEWVMPEEQDEEGNDGSLCYVMYKVQHGSENRFETVRERTESQDKWNKLRFGEDQWYHHAKHAPGIVYLPVESGSEVVDELQTLKKHFSEEYISGFQD